MEMSSLVAYEDSETDDDPLDQTEERESATVQTVSCEQNQEVSMCYSSEATLSHRRFIPEPDTTVLEYHGSASEGSSFSLHPNSQPHGCFDMERRSCSDRTAQEKHLRGAIAPQSLGVTQGKISQLPSLHMASRTGDKLTPAKRLGTVSPGVRPYIPKRQRLAALADATDSKFPVEHFEGNQTRLLSDVSEKVKFYLDHKPSAAGIPRRLLMSLGSHQGPVNTLQWCPVPHLSHLLLSASMDKTFKV